MNTLKRGSALLLALALSLTSCDVIASSEDGPLSASGVVEAVEVLVAAEFSGRITEVLVEESEAVEAGQPLFRLEDDSVQIRRRQILAAGDASIAAATLELVSAKQALKQLREDAPLMFAQAQVDLANAHDTLDDAERRRSYQQRGRRATSETIEGVEAQLVLAEDAVDDAQAALNKVDHKSSADPERAAAEAALYEARQHRDAVKSALNWYTGEPTDIDQAILDANVALAFAQVAQAELELEKWKNGPDPDALALAESRVANAEAQLEFAEAQLAAELDAVDLELEKYVVRAPIGGVVITRNVQPGELILAGTSAMTIGRLDDLTLTVYLPEDRYGQVTLGDEARVQVDSFPDETFPAVVVRIADRAEFTPRNVQTEESRRSTVFAIELSVDDTSGRLKPGMPADVTFSSLTSAKLEVSDSGGEAPGSSW